MGHNKKYSKIFIKNEWIKLKSIILWMHVHFMLDFFPDFSEYLCNLFIKRVFTNKIDHVCSRLKLQRNRQSDKPNVETVISKQYDTICQLGHEAYIAKFTLTIPIKSKVSNSIKIQNLLDTGMQIS